MEKRKTYRLMKRACLAFLCGGLAWACAKDELSVAGGVNGGGGLAAYREQVVTKAAQPDSWFAEGTEYRIWVTNRGTTTPDMPNDNAQGNGYVGTETVREDDVHYINFRPVEGNVERDFYGFTSASQEAPEAKKVNETYRIERTDGADYTDYLRGELIYPYGGAIMKGGILQMPFKHIMAQVCFQASMSTDVKGKIEIVSVELLGDKEGKTGITKSGTYQVYENEFTFDGEEIRTAQPANPLALSEKAGVIDTLLIFPTYKTEKEAETAEAQPENAPVTYMRITFTDKDGVYKEFGKDDDGNKQITLPIYNANTNDPLVFRQNHSYTLHVTFITDQQRVVMLVPQVLNWIEKEGTEDTGWMATEDLGQPVTFNGLLWSDRNLGATSGNPTRSVEDWYNSLGYIYQYGRNIPYYPFTVNENGKGSGNYTVYDTPADEAYQNNRLIYPVINPESWGVEGAMGGEGRWYIHPVTNQNNGNPGLVWDLDGERFQKLYARDPGYADFGYYNLSGDYKLSYLDGYQGDWLNNTNTPCPPGWRLPTLSEFMSILPSSSFAGNITFRRFDGTMGGNGGPIAMGRDDAERDREPDFESAFSQRRIEEMTDPGNRNQPAYEGYFPYIYREENDDFQDGTDVKGQYILSMADEDRIQIRNRKEIEGLEGWLGRDIDRNGDSQDFNWGVIYGIKNQGTARAYRMKWSIRLMYEGQPTKYDDGSMEFAAEDNPFHGVLVIERFEATKEDTFEPERRESYGDVLKKYDWEHPVAVMYLPIGGICDAEWSKGKMANVGSEVWYATSETAEDNGGTARKKIVWIKFAGSSCKDSQAISTTDKSQLGAAIFIRPVRDF